MKFRRATWGKHGDVWDWRGYAWSLLTKKRIYSFEFQVQHQPPGGNMPEETKVNGCRGRGICGCSYEGPGAVGVKEENHRITDRDPGDETVDLPFFRDDRISVEFTTQIPREKLGAMLYPSDRHPSSQAFVDRVTGWIELHDKKQRDYGSDADPFANIREGARQLGLPAWIGAVLRMNDKMRRLNTAAKQYIETGEVNLSNEGVIDSFDDLGVYSGIGATVYAEEAADHQSFA